MTHRIAVLPGDGVGPEVVAEARKAVDALGLPLAWTELPWGSAWYREHGRMMPEDALDTLRDHDAVLLGAIGDPSVPDHVALWDTILEIRQGLDLWANLRPCRLLPGIPTPLAGREPDDVDFLVVRENTEGEYAGVGGRSHRGLDSEVALETSVFTRDGVRRVVRYAFEMAASRRGTLTSATKSNASRFGYVLWDEVVEETAAEFDGVRVERVLVDALAARMVRDPEASTSSSPRISSATSSPTSRRPSRAAWAWRRARTSLPAPTRRASSSPCTARRRTSPARGSPTPPARSGARRSCSSTWERMRLPRALMNALERVCAQGPRTRDVGGEATTAEVGDAVADAVTELRR